MVGIPINVAILLFTTYGKGENGQYPYSATVQFLMDQTEGRTLFEVVLILVLVEHIILGLKVAIAQLIPDVPKEVVMEEAKRPKIEELAA